jgi:hypothetical protein
MVGLLLLGKTLMFLSSLFLWLQNRDDRFSLPRRIITVLPGFTPSLSCRLQARCPLC